MSTLYVTEFSEMPISDNGVPLIGMTPPLVDQSPITISGSTALSSAFNAKTCFIRVHTDTICSIAFAASGVSVSATTSNMRLAANQTEYFGVQGGGKVAVIANT